MIKFRGLFPKICALLFLSARLFAREISVYVEDRDLEIPLEGALIRSWDGKEYVCDEEGRALVEVPDDRQVVIHGIYPGYENGRLVIGPGESGFTLGLRLAGILESRELVFEADRPGVSETRTGRSVALSEKNIERVAEIGIIEDVMTAVKLLPGVGYTNTFNAQPSIRGGHPGDLIAALDGFYVAEPYFWGGAFSIFDPRMVKSAQLSHGVFSTRYGHTISGLLEVKSRRPSSADAELELGISTSVTNLALSIPLFGKGGVMLMGKITYYDPIVWAAKGLSNHIEELEIINAVSTTPYIRTGTLTADYRVNQDLSLDFTGFFGADGAGALYENESEEQGYTSKSDMEFDWLSHQLFLTGALTWNPRPEMMIGSSAGWGYYQQDLLGDTVYNVNVPFSERFKQKYPGFFPGLGDSYSFGTKTKIRSVGTTINLQGRIDYDWDLGNGFLFALGIQELYTRWIEDVYLDSRSEEERGSYLDKIEASMKAQGLPFYPSVYNINGDYINYPAEFSAVTENSGYTSSAYSLMEYSSPKGRFGAELGLRLDHFYFLGEGFSLNSTPVLNPRLNLDFGVLENRGIIESLSLSAGTGLFSSTSDVVSILERSGGDIELRPNRSVSTVAGAKIEFPEGLSLNIEAYYKHVFDRIYLIDSYIPGNIATMNREYHFDGQGRIWGLDFMLQKLESRYWDGWISYSFNHAMYREPDHSNGNGNGTGPASGAWYYPGFHRFHVINLFLNIKPLRQFNISARLGFVSGVPLSVIDGSPESYSVQILESGQIIEKWKRPSHRDNDNRSTWSLPLDVKFSLYRFNRKGKVSSEIYLAVENVLALVYKAKGNTTFNSYTGEEDLGNDTASYEIPVPIPSFGFKWSY
ncbi:MAG: hypothetical protein LBH26_08070 [Treponema sp.]|jgi:hypothetical protein|nr:hypothetical protein [Treponema sp.]